MNSQFSSPPQYTLRQCVAEGVATFILVFSGTGAAVVNEVQSGSVSHVGVALTFGLVVMALIYAVGEESGAHLNPAVTLGFVTAGRFPLRAVVPYICSQCAGAFLGSILLKILFPSSQGLGGTQPAGPPVQSFILELVLTFILMFVVLQISSGAKEKGIMAGAAVGAVIAFEALFAGPISGASMNPARSLSPAVVSGNVQHVWIYLLAPILGANLASVLVRWMRGLPGSPNN